MDEKQYDDMGHTGSSVNRRQFLGALGYAGIGIAAAATGLPARSASTEPEALPAASPFALKFDDAGAIVSLRRVGDAYPTDYIAPQSRLGDTLVRYRSPGSGAADWLILDTSQDTSALRNGEARDNFLSVTTLFQAERDALLWTTTIRNLTPNPVEIGDLALALPMNTEFKAGAPATASVLKHSFISGHGSHIFWMRSNSVGPYLCLMPQGQTHLEYWDAHGGHPYRVYVHSLAAAEEIKAHGGRWRQPNTSATLAAAGGSGDGKTVTLRLEWASGGYDGVRDCFIKNDLIDVLAIPGMTVPTDLNARIALRTRQPIHALEAEFGSKTRITPLGKKGIASLYEIQFTRLGENRLTVRYGDGRHLYLEFFATQPVETLIKKRAAFTARHQHRDPSKWYDGLLAEWNMQDEVMLGPDNYDKITGWRIYEVTCDDPGLSKPAYLAAKNAEHPSQSEVEALDYYVRHFVWGGLQRTTSESYAYGIYGIPDWKANRDSSDPETKGKLHLWRCYDYPHIILMYFSLYRVAKNHTRVKTEMSARQYLERAAGTAKAFFTVPNELVQWSPYETGYYNELIIPDLIDALKDEGMDGDAATLQSHWEKKVKFFVADNPNLFGSEYAFDSTGFESTHALAKYALAHAGKSSGNLAGVTGHKAREFMQRQMAANLFCRGWLEPAYYYYGSDYRGSAGDAYTLSYMAQMGGWAVLDFALRYAADPCPYLQLGYASTLSSWALMNAGDPESNYGAWFPGAINDGGAGGGFEPAAYGMTWLDQPHHRGSWYYSCEINLGYCGALRAAATIIADDPLFGRIAYGGVLRETSRWLEITPKDGVRRRLHLLIDRQRVHITSDSLRFSAETPLLVRQDFSEIIIPLEGDPPASGTASFRFAGLPAGSYILRSGGHRQTIHSQGDQSELIAEVPVARQIGAVSLRRA